MDHSPPSFSVNRFFQARILERVPAGDLPHLGIEPTSVNSPVFAGGFFTTSTTWEGLPPTPKQLDCQRIAPTHILIISYQ